MANNKYYNQAQSQYDGSYNQKVANLNNQLAQNQANLENQKGGINQNYDGQVKQQNLANVKSKNNLSNGMLGRGLGASSIAVTGLAEADNINTRMVGDINTARTNSLNEIDKQKLLLAQQNEAMLNSMKADRLDGIQALAYQLEDRDFDKNFKNQQLAWEREKFNREQAWREQQAQAQAYARQQANSQAYAHREALKQQALKKQVANMGLQASGSILGMMPGGSLAGTMLDFVNSRR